MNQDAYRFDYRIELEDGQETRFQITLDPVTLTMQTATCEPYADWTLLDYNQCRGCPLTPAHQRYCPIAVNITDMVEKFKDILSHKNCLVVCETVDRTYSKKTSAMEALTSVFGIIMATSDCPVMNFLKPMARFHLPFASVEETTVRSTSMFLLGQYFEYKRSGTKHFDFEKLEKNYARVQLVNEGLLARIRSLGNQDADKNAIITLHSISHFLSIEMDFSLTTIAHLFERGRA
ncbi:conserved hypothetical protein [Desulfosarcina cetonica]|uniref:DUF6901 family protein n=1 Tax=Desulfosarcina cetonica TaxID=90730 RepID=UPI0006D02FE9|nr:hypothetical protein [Desulfosarcina cetonica]VTR63812.1 conserved hypothetical protein [Desulfosarcina cetonica]